MALVVSSGGSIEAAPRLRLPDGEISLTLTDTAGAPVSGADVAVYVLEGGGGFPSSQFARFPIRSQTSAVSDGTGTVALPEFVLGPQAGSNRLLVQSDSDWVEVVIEGTYDNVSISVAPTTTADQQGLCNSVVQFAVQLQDATYPAQPIEGAGIGVTVRDGGGWLQSADGFLRAYSDVTDTAGSFAFGVVLSSRDETTTIAVFLLENDVQELVLTAEAHRPRLLSSETPSRSETIDNVATGWLSTLARLGIEDTTTDDYLGASGNPLPPPAEILAKETSCAVVPDVRSGWGTITSLALRPASAGPFSADFWLPDFPDDPPRSIHATAFDDLDTNVVPPVSTPPAYVQTTGGGVVDSEHGVALQLEGGDFQFVGPNRSSTAPWTVSVLTSQLPGYPNVVLEQVHLFFKVRMAPGNSVIDDPAAPQDNVPGTVSLTPGAGGDLLQVDVDGTPGQDMVEVWFNANEHNYDHMVELTATVTLNVLQPDGSWLQQDEDTTLLARALFPRPRLSFTSKSGSDFVPIDELAICPAVVVDETGAEIAHDSDREIYVELRGQDFGASLTVKVSGGDLEHDGILLEQVGAPPGSGYTLYRSKPIVTYLEDPAAFGLSDFSFSPDYEYVRVIAPYTVQARTDGTVVPGNPNIVPIPDNPLPVTYATPVRPVAFLNLELATPGALTTFVPRPSIRFTGLDASDALYPIVIENGVACVELYGEVTDVLADLAPPPPGAEAPIEINGNSFPVTGSGGGGSDVWPDSWSGMFDAKVELEPGLNVFVVSTSNALGGTASRVVYAELIDSRNDFANPDATAMQVRVAVASEPDRYAPPRLAYAHYRSAPQNAASALPASTTVTVEAYDSANATDSMTLALTATQSVEDGYVSAPLVLVPDSVDPADLQAARAAGLSVLAVGSGGRVRVTGTMPHPSGPLPLQVARGTELVEHRLLVWEEAAADFIETDSVSPGDELTIEVRDNEAIPQTMLEVDLVACDRLGQRLAGSDRTLHIYLQAGPNTGWLRMAAYDDVSHTPVAATSLTVFGRSPDLPPQQAAIRVEGGGTLRPWSDLGADTRLWPIVDDPRRQELAGADVPQDSPCGTSARMGAIDSVIAATGEVAFFETDASLRGRGLDLAFIRSYRSFNDYDGLIGQNWAHSYDTWLRRRGGSAGYRFVHGDGRTYDFDTAGSGFDSPAGIYAALEEVGDAECCLRGSQGLVQVFAALGPSEPLAPPGADDPRLFAIAATTDRCGNTLRFVRDQTGVLAAVVSSLSQRHQLRYGERGRLEALGDSTGNVWLFKYYDGHTPGGAPGDLESVRAPIVAIGPQTYPDGLTHSYEYEDADPDSPKRHKLTSIQDPVGYASQTTASPLPPFLSLDFDDDGRVITQGYGDGSFTFGYTPGTTTIVDRKGNEKRWTFGSGPAVTTEETLGQTFVEVDPADITTAYEYNGQGELASVTAPSGAATEVTFDDGNTDPRFRGTILTLTRRPATDPVPRPAGRGMWTPPATIASTIGLADFDTDPVPAQPGSLSWSFTYDDRFQQLKTRQDPTGATATYTYDYEDPTVGREDGNLVRLDLPDSTVGAVGGAASQGRSHVWRYDNYGQPVLAVDADGAVSSYTYYTEATPGTGGTTSGANDPSGWLASVTIDSAASPPAGAPPRSPSLVPAEPARMSFEYDQRGFVSTWTDGLQKTTTLQHNELGQLVQRTDAEGLVETFAYDSAGMPYQRTATAFDLRLPTGAGAPPALVDTVTYTYEFDRRGNLTKEIVDDGGAPHVALTTTREYDPNDNLAWLRTPEATGGQQPDDVKRVIKYEYDGRDRLAFERRAPGTALEAVTTYAFGDDGDLIGRTDAYGITLETRYDGWGRQFEQEDDLGNVYRILYDELGAATITEVDGSIDGDPTNRGLLAAQTAYRDEGGRLTAVADKVFRWSNGVIATIGAGRRITTYERDPGGNAAITHSPRSLASTAAFRGDGRPCLVSDPLTGERTFAFDAAGNLRATGIPAPPPATGSLTLERDYDDVGRMTSIEMPGGGKTYYYYDELGRCRLMEDPLGNRTWSTYDGAGRLVAVAREMRDGGRLRDPLTGAENTLLDTLVTQYGYDLNGNLESVTDPDQTIAISHVYDACDRRISTTLAGDAFPTLGRDDNPGPESYFYTHYANGLLQTLTTPDGIVIEITYDGAGRVSSRVVQTAPPGVAIPGSTAQTFKHDGLDRCVYAADAEPGLQTCNVSLAYDSLGNAWEDVQTETYTGGPQSRTVAASYDVNGDLADLQYQDNGPLLGFSFDGAGRLRVVGGVVGYRYVNQYLDRRTHLPSNVALDVGHSPDGFVASYRYAELDGGGNPIRALYGERYASWNEAGLPVVVVNENTSKARYHQYDSAQRLVKTYDNIDLAVITGLLPVTGNRGIFTDYDRRGNAKRLLVGTISSVGGSLVNVDIERLAERTVNSVNEIGQSVEYAPPGGLVSAIGAGISWFTGLSVPLPAAVRTDVYTYDKRGNLVSDPDRTYAYDAFNRLTLVTDRQSGTTTSFRYDPFGRRLVKGQTRFVYHGGQMIEEIPANGNWRKRYVCGAEGVVRFDMVTAAGTKRYGVHDDRGGSVLFLTDDSASVVENYTYDPYGQPILLGSAGSLPWSAGVGNSFLAQGQYYDEETSLYHVGTRDYHPALQRMLQRDAAGVDDAGNTYVYSNNNLQGYRDPSGNTEEFMPPAEMPVADSAAAAETAPAAEALETEQALTRVQLQIWKMREELNYEEETRALLAEARAAVGPSAEVTAVGEGAAEGTVATTSGLTAGGVATAAAVVAVAAAVTAVVLGAAVWLTSRAWARQTGFDLANAKYGPWPLSREAIGTTGAEASSEFVRARDVGLQTPKRRATEIGKDYDRRVTRFWEDLAARGAITPVPPSQALSAHHYRIGRSVEVLIQTNIASGSVQRVDQAFIDHEAATIWINDVTSLYRQRHWTKGAQYVQLLQQRYPGYRVRYNETYWRGFGRLVQPTTGRLFARIEAILPNGTKYIPDIG